MQAGNTTLAWHHTHKQAGGAGCDQSQGQRGRCVLGAFQGEAPLPGWVGGGCAGAAEVK